MFTITLSSRLSIFQQVVLVNFSLKVYINSISCTNLYMPSLTFSLARFSRIQMWHVKSVNVSVVILSVIGDVNSHNVKRYEIQFNILSSSCKNSCYNEKTRGKVRPIIKLSTNNIFDFFFTKLVYHPCFLTLRM